MKLFNIDDFFGLRTIDVFGLMYGYKKIISSYITETFLQKLTDAFSRHGLKYVVLDKSYDYKHSSLTYLISKKTKYLLDAKSAYKSGQFDVIGKYLGYPSCCVDFYCKNFIKNDYASVDYIAKIYHNSSRFYWKLNNILNFDGRIKKCIGYSKELAPFISLISHCPCSYNCKKSLKIANINYKYYLLYKSLGLKYYSILKMPVLYIDDFHFVIFYGASDNNSIQYRTMLYCLGERKIIPYLLNADRLTIYNNSVIIYKGTKMIKNFDYGKQILVLPFDRNG